jgi:hypothetical protein
VSLYKIYTHYKQILNAPLRFILIRNDVIYALYNVLSNWSSGTISLRHLLGPKRLQIAALRVHPNPNDHDYYCYCSRSARADLGRERAPPRSLPRHVRVARGPRGRTLASGQGRRARARRVRPRDHARLPAHQRGPPPQRVRIPGPRRLRRSLARRTRQGAARAQGHGRVLPRQGA